MRGGAVLATLVVLAACTTAPFTRRSQLMLVSPEQETKLGAQAYQQVLSKSRVDSRPVVVKPIEDVGRRLAAAANQPNYQWRFTVIDDPKQVNAFCLPGGKVAVYTGILPIAVDTSGLAVVLGHEIGHAVARHGAERMSQTMAAQAGQSVLGALLGGGPGTQAILTAYGLGAQVGVLLPFSRAQESEADHIGLILMARAGYDPHAAIAFWQRMEQHASGGEPPQFLSTHPSHGTREQQLRVWLPEALPYYEATSHAPVESLPAQAATAAR